MKRCWMKSERGTDLLVELKDFDLNKLANRQIFKSSRLHALNKFRIDLEDTHLDQLLRRWVEAHRLYSLHLRRRNTVDFHGDQIICRVAWISQSREALRIICINFKDAQSHDIIRSDSPHSCSLKRLE